MGSRAAHRSQMESTGGRNGGLLIGLTAVWIAFTVFTVVVLLDFGVVGFIEAAVANEAVTQTTIDLIFSIVIALSFMRSDARQRDLPYWPYVVATALTGSIGLIAYLIHRTWQGRRSSREATT